MSKNRGSLRNSNPWSGERNPRRSTEVQRGCHKVFILGLLFLLACLNACENTVRTTVKVPTLPPDAIDDEAIRYLRITDFSGDLKCARSLKSKVEALTTAAPLKRYEVVQTDLHNPRETMLVTASVDSCSFQRGRGELRAVFSLRNMDIQRKQYVISEETNRPGASPAEVQTVLIDRAAKSFVTKAFPTFKKEIRTFQPLSGKDPGLSAAKIKNWDSAATYWANQLSQDPGNDRIRYNLGIVYEAKGDYSKAYESYLEASQLNDREEYLEARIRAEKSLKILGQPLPELIPRETDHTAPCKFLKEEPQPGWVTRPPEYPDRYVGVGMATRQRNGQEQLSLSAANARAELAAGIQVNIRSDFEAWWQETHGGSLQNTQSTLSSKTTEEIHQRTDELLRDSKIEKRWLNRKPCHLYTLVSVSHHSVKRVKQEFKDKWEQSDLSKNVMLFDLSGDQAEVSQKLRVLIEDLLREMGPTVVPAAQGFEGCAQDTTLSICRQREKTIFGGVTVKLAEERLSGRDKGRYYHIQGQFLEQDRTVSSFNEACEAIGPANQSNQFFSELAAKNCMNKIGPILQRDFNRSMK